MRAWIDLIGALGVGFLAGRWWSFFCMRYALRHDKDVLPAIIRKYTPK